MSSVSRVKSSSVVDQASLKELETDYLLGRPSSEVVVKGKWSIAITREKVLNVITAVCLWLGYLVVSAAYSLYAPFFPEEAAAKGASPAMVGVIVSSSPLCVVFLAPVFGYLLPRLGLRFTLLAGLWLVGGGFFLLGFMSSPQISSGWMFVTFCVILGIIKGIGSALFFTAVFALLPELFPNHVTTVLGLFEVGSGLGCSIGPALGGFLYDVGGFSLPFHVLGGVTLFFLIPYFILVKNFAVVNVLLMASSSFLIPTFQPFLHKYFNLDPLHIGFIFLYASLAYMILALIVGLLSDNLGPRGFIIFGVLLFGVSFVFIGPADFISTPRYWLAVTALIVSDIGFAIGVVPVYGDMLSVAKRISPKSVDSEALNGVLAGVISSIDSFGEVAGPIIGGGLVQYYDFQTSALLFGEVLFAVGLLLLGSTLVDRIFSCMKQQSKSYSNI